MLSLPSFMQRRHRLILSSSSSSSSSSSFILNHFQKQWNNKSTTTYRSFASSSSSINNTIKFESGIIGHLAASNTLCTSKGTVVHAAISIGDKIGTSNNNSSTSTTSTTSSTSLPLNVDYKLKAYAYGMIPDTRNRREANNSNEEMLAARVVDRSIRPLFSTNTSSSINEMQVTCTVHSLDLECDPIATAVNAASCALMQTRLDWQGPVGCVRVGRVNGELKVNLTAEERLLSDLDLLYTGTESRVLM